MTTFHLVRHVPHALQDSGVLVGRAPDVGLGEEGLAMLPRLAARFEGVAGVEAVLSGPLGRAVATAEAVAAAVGLRAAVAAELDEVDFGAWAGRRFEELAADPLWAAWNGFRSGTRAPEGESMLEVQGRALGLVERLRERHPSGRVVLVSHGDVIRGALLHFLGMTLDLVHRIEVAPGSVSTVAVGREGAVVLGVNDTGRLA